MKKFQMMMATVLVALMAFAVQSCSSNDDKVDLSTSTYELVGAFNVQKQGEFTDAEIEEFRNSFSKAESGTYMSDQMAESHTDQIVGKYAAILQEIAVKSSESTAVFTITITTTNLKTKNVVSKWDIIWDKGSVSSKKY